MCNHSYLDFVNMNAYMKFIEILSISKEIRADLLHSYFLTASYYIGLGAKSQILSSVAPPRKKKLVTIFSQGQVWGPQKPMFY